MQTNSSTWLTKSESNARVQTNSPLFPWLVDWQHILPGKLTAGFCQLIFSVFKTLTDQKVTVELKNDLSITGVLKSVDQYAESKLSITYLPWIPACRFLNIRLDNIEIADEARHPHMVHTLRPHVLREGFPDCPLVDGRKKLFYSRIGCPLRAVTCWACWHTIVGRCDP